MHIGRLSTGCLALLVIVAAGCGEEKINNPKPLGLRLTPLPDEEAEVMALWMSGEIEAPMDLYTRIHNDLQSIRRDFGDIPVLDSITFTSPWQPGVLLFDLGPSAGRNCRITPARCGIH